MKLLNNIFETTYQNNVGLSGMTDESFSLYINNLYQKENRVHST